MDMISLLLRTGEPSRSTCGKLGGTCGGGGRGKEPEEGGGLPSLISVALGARVMASENRSGVGPFTSNVRGDYTLIEVV